VTQKQWKLVAGTEPSLFKGENLPVEQISWWVANEYCTRLTARAHQEGTLPANCAYVLPPEAQWEYACRASTTGAYAGALEEMAWYASNADGKTHPVAGKKPNAWGLYDMHGNVNEWVADWCPEWSIVKWARYPGGQVSDPFGPQTGTKKLERGGSLFAIARMQRSAMRSAADPNDKGEGLGFRIALVRGDMDLMLEDGFSFIALDGKRYGATELAGKPCLVLRLDCFFWTDGGWYQRSEYLKRLKATMDGARAVRDKGVIVLVAVDSATTWKAAEADRQALVAGFPVFSLAERSNWPFQPIRSQPSIIVLDRETKEVARGIEFFREEPSGYRSLLPEIAKRYFQVE